MDGINLVRDLLYVKMVSLLCSVFIIQEVYQATFRAILLSSSGQCFLRDNLLHQEVCCWDQKVDYIRVVSVALCYIIVRLGKLKNNM